MSAARQFLNGAALAAAVMYWFDSTSGRRRRARLRDRLVSLARGAQHAAEVGGRDLAHRVQGLAAETRALFDHHEVTDAVLSERVRAALGRSVSHPGAIEVAAADGYVRLSGDVLANEYQQLMRAVHAVRGVRDVEDRLAVHSEARGVSALQGGRPRRPARFELLQENWSPAARLLTSVSGGALVLHGLRSRGVLGILSAAAGGALLARSTTNVPLRRLAGGSGRRAVDIRKTIRVAAPVDEVFELLADYENFPRFMRNVRQVRMHPDGRSHWIVAGPAGVPVEWDAVTTALQPNQLLAWRTVPNAIVAHAGIIRFEPYDGGTRIDIRLSYNPPAGALGHVVARLFGADPKSELDQDLVRLKSFLETGKAPRDAALHEPPLHGPAAPGGSPEAAQSLH